MVLLLLDGIDVVLDYLNCCLVSALVSALDVVVVAIPGGVGIAGPVGSSDHLASTIAQWNWSLLNSSDSSCS